MKIITAYNPPPIPMRCFDWTAIDDDTYDLGEPIGYGASEAEAIDDLKEKMMDDQRNPARRSKRARAMMTEWNLLPHEEAELLRAAREGALLAHTDQAYLPNTPELAMLFQPHKWVLEAMRRAYSMGRTTAGAHRAREEIRSPGISVDGAGRLEGFVMPINVIFDGPPGPEAGRFVEVETDDGESVRVGEWIERPDGLWALRITELPEA